MKKNELINNGPHQLNDGDAVLGEVDVATDGGLLVCGDLNEHRICVEIQVAFFRFKQYFKIL